MFLSSYFKELRINNCGCPTRLVLQRKIQPCFLSAPRFICLFPSSQASPSPKQGKREEPRKKKGKKKKPTKNSRLFIFLEYFLGDTRLLDVADEALRLRRYIGPGEFALLIALAATYLFLLRRACSSSRVTLFFNYWPWFGVVLFDGHLLWKKSISELDRFIYTF